MYTLVFQPSAEDLFIDLRERREEGEREREINERENYQNIDAREKH